jgi:hypothetical protein
MSNNMSNAERKRIRNFAVQNDITDKIKSLKPGKKILVQPVEDFFTLEINKIRSDNNIPDKEKKRLETLVIETEKNKKLIAEQLRKTPIVQFACEKTGVGRSTYYKWRAKDLIFARAADRAIEAGRFFINDLAESKLIGLIQNSHPTAIIFWLKHNHPKYTEISRVIHEYETVTSKPSVEEGSMMAEEMAKIMAKKISPEYTTEELKQKVEEELEEAELNKDNNKRLESFEEDENN